MKDYLGVAPRVKLVEPNTLQRSAGAVTNVIDKRQI
jgi:phenylacetate-coenzyme A ligase PaaK-like adenylate-forming protein